MHSIFKFVIVLAVIKKCSSVSVGRTASKVGGFGVKQKSINLPPKDVSKSETEKSIQDKISSDPKLKEAFDLHMELSSLKRKLESMSVIEKSMVPLTVLNMMRAKEERLVALEKEGLTELMIHNRLHEITWDSTAAVRAIRHANEDIPTEMKTFMTQLALDLVSSGKSDELNILDVGTGTGILFDFIKATKEGGRGSSQKSNKKKITMGIHAERTKVALEGCVGVDLSSEMVRIARQVFEFEFNDSLMLTRQHQSHPEVQFHHGDFLDYPGKVDGFQCVVFNECFHNFINQATTLAHAVRLCKPGSSKIIISHPRGFNNVELQHRSNRMLVPNPLPTRLQLEQLVEDVIHSLGEATLLISVPPNIASPHYLAVIEVQKIMR